MALSLIVLLIPVVLVIVAYRTLYQGDTVVTVDPTEAIASAGRNGLTQLPPATAPEGWLIVSATFRDGVLRIGYLDRDQKGVQLVQARGTLEQPRAGEKALVGSRDGVSVMLLTKDADLTPLAKLLPIPVSGNNSG
jgi:Protein of unknown function (DUF4245)